MRSQPGTSLRVLIVDDSIDTASSLALLLKMWGHDVCATHDGLSAVDLAREFRPDAVILDIGLPQIDGFEVAARLRAHAGFERTLIVGSSGYSREADRRRADEVGINLYLVKPFDASRLEAILGAHLASLHEVPA